LRCSSWRTESAALISAASNFRWRPSSSFAVLSNCETRSTAGAFVTLRSALY
jgi:hypothetical protein